MIIKSPNRIPIRSTDQYAEYPVLRLMTGVLFPGSILTIQISRPDSKALIRQYQMDRQTFVSSHAHAEIDQPGPPPIHQVGVFTIIRDVKEGPSDSMLVTLEGVERACIKQLTVTEPVLKVMAAEVKVPRHVASRIEPRIDQVIGIVDEITQLDPIYSPELVNVLKTRADDPSGLADSVAASFHFSLSVKQELLEAVNLEARYERLLYHLNGELNRVTTVLNINDKVKHRIQEEQHRYYLRQQLYEIKRQLGEDFSENRDVTRYRGIVKNSPGLPVDVVARAKMEIDRLSQISEASAEYGATKDYLKWLLSMPWGKVSSEMPSIEEAGKILAADYYGQVTIREQVLQRLSVRLLSGGTDDGPTLCLVGAPGTGKASLAKAIAHSLDRPLVRISVGGINDVEEIKGTSRSQVRGTPGRIIRALKDCPVCDPVVLLEDIDYFNTENDASVNMALLDVINSQVNDRFLDDYIGVPFDLSRMFFICSVRSWEEVPEQFAPKLEILEIQGYTEKQKIAIARRYILPAMFKRHGLGKTDIKITGKILKSIITHYTQETGLVGFSQQMEKICRKVAVEKAKGSNKSWTVNDKNLNSYLGTEVFIPERPEKEPEIGIATGLAWTGSGGELMFIEGLRMKGEGSIVTTGSLGEVMRESITAAHSYVRSKADWLGIDFSDFSEFDLHIHFPSGAIPKDGPSAGVTVSLVIASVMAERPIRNDIALTGEVTLRGRVLPVGGLKEKIAAAYRAGIYHIALPKENEKDLSDLPAEIRRKTKFHLIERVDELFDLCLLDFKPSAFTLEKIFADEIKKARKRTSSRSRKTKTKAARSRKSK